MENKKSSYSESHRRYYEANKDKVKAYQQEKKPYKAYYEKHKEEIIKRQLERYHAKKALKQNPPVSEDAPAHPPGLAVV